MNIDLIFKTLREEGVDYLLIGGINFMLRHKPILTFDVDIWIKDNASNRTRCEKALVKLKAEWGASESEWMPVKNLPAGWLERQQVFCVTTKHGALDIFRHVPGPDSWQGAAARSVKGRTADGIHYRGLSDPDMLACQEALPAAERNSERMAFLRKKIAETSR